MILLYDRCIEMQRGKDGEVAGALLEYLIEIPRLEMLAHADQQRALADAAARSHPGRDRYPSLAVHPGRRDKTETPSQQHVARAALPALPCHLADERLVPVRHARVVVDEHAGIVRMQPDEQIPAYAAGLYRYAEMLGN